MSRFNYFDTHAPKCPSYGCIITRIGEFCQSCRYKYELEDDECTCCDNARECKSKLDHYCCCATVWDVSKCKADRIGHDCTCESGYVDDCGATEHECSCEFSKKDCNIHGSSSDCGSDNSE
jgi:hypothetical protein